MNYLQYYNFNTKTRQKYNKLIPREMKKFRTTQPIEPLNIKNQNMQISQKQKKSSHTLALYASNDPFDSKYSQPKQKQECQSNQYGENDQNCHTMATKSNRKCFIKNKQIIKQIELTKNKTKEKESFNKLPSSKEKEVNQLPRRFKTTQTTTPISNQANQSQFLKTFYNTSQQFIRTHKPFLENKRIIFNVKNRNRNCEREYDKKFQTDRKIDTNQNNIERLKKQIKELDKQDFVSYRSKCFSNADQIKIISNDKISKYNYQNSMIVEWKGKVFQKPCLARPSSTIGVSQNCTTNPNSNTNSNIIAGPMTPITNFVGFYSHSSAPKKYFSKPKNRKNYIINTNENSEVTGSNILNSSKLKLKTEEIAIGLNMFRGKIHRKKVNSSFQIHCC